MRIFAWISSVRSQARSGSIASPARSIPPTPASTRSSRRASSLPRSREDLIRIVRICAEHRCSLTMRGGGTSQAGQAIGAGVIVDTSKYLNRVLELNAGERWARVEPGIVLDELNAAAQGARTAIRTRHLDRQPRHGRRHDGQQFERRALGPLRQDDRSCARAGGRARPMARSRISAPLSHDGARGEVRRRGSRSGVLSSGPAPRAGARR